MNQLNLSAMKRIFHLCFYLLLSFGGLSIQIHAQSAGAFSRLGIGARGIAMGNSLVADGFGNGNVFYNPALAPYIGDQHIEATYSAMTFDRQLQFLQFSSQMKPQAGISAGLIHAGVSNIDGRDGSGYHTDTYATNEYAFFLIFGTQLGKRTSAGLRFTYYRDDLFDHVTPATSIGISAGLAIKASENLRIGIAADDLLGKYAWDTAKLYEEEGRGTTDQLPKRFRLGAAYRAMKGKLIATGEVESRVANLDSRTNTAAVTDGIIGLVTSSETLKIQDTFVRFGGEYWIAEPFALRLGVDHVGKGGFAEALPSAGFSIKQKLGELRLQIDYAFKLEPFKTGTMHLLGLHLGL
jgi:hypothetical protein